LEIDTFLLQDKASRRAFERCPVDVPVILISIHRGTTSFHEARTADVCEGGMGVLSSAPLVPHQPISVEFTVPLANQLLKLKAVVRHQRTPDGSNGADRFGLQFLAATLAQKNQLKRLAQAC
jgi:c-di-GMP-binding flagellar brake protein YcgR